MLVVSRPPPSQSVRISHGGPRKQTHGTHKLEREKYCTPLSVIFVVHAWIVMSPASAVLVPGNASARDPTSARTCSKPRKFGAQRPAPRAEGGPWLGAHARAVRRAQKALPASLQGQTEPRRHQSTINLSQFEEGALAPDLGDRGAL